MAVPKNIPALIGSVAKKKSAIKGYNNIPVNPKIVILATAYDISSSRAFITGEVAIIAVTPQIPVPTAINVPNRFDCFILFVKYNVKNKPLEIHAIINGIPSAPSFNASTKLKRNPSKIIPARKAYFKEKLIPLEK